MAINCVHSRLKTRKRNWNGMPELDCKYQVRSVDVASGGTTIHRKQQEKAVLIWGLDEWYNSGSAAAQPP